MFKPESKSKIYLGIFAIISGILGWAFYSYYKPKILEAACSEQSLNSSGILNPKRYELEVSEYDYEKVKSKCIQNALLINN